MRFKTILLNIILSIFYFLNLIDDGIKPIHIVSLLIYLSLILLLEVFKDKNIKRIICVLIILAVFILQNYIVSYSYFLPYFLIYIFNSYEKLNYSLISLLLIFIIDKKDIAGFSFILLIFIYITYYENKIHKKIEKFNKENIDLNIKLQKS